MNSIDVPKVIGAWLEGFTEELEIAQKLAELCYFPQAHFHLHLCIEKRIKAIIVGQTRIHAPYSHNLTFLLGKTDLEPTEMQLSWLSTITEFNLNGRYSEEKSSKRKEFNAVSWNLWFQRASEVIKWLDQNSLQIS